MAEHLILQLAEQFAEEIIGNIKQHDFKNRRTNIDHSFEEIVNALNDEYTEESLSILRKLERINAF